MEDLLEDFIKYIAELYIGLDRDIETDNKKKVVKQPQIKLSEALIAL